MYAVLPKGAKPSKSLSRDPTRPILTHAELRETEAGWELVACDSYQLARVKLSTKDDSGADELVAGPISTEALKAAEKAGAFYANGTVEPCDSFGRRVGASYARVLDVGQFPKWDSITPDLDEATAQSVGLDAAKLYDLAQSLGKAARVGRNQTAAVRLTFHANSDGTINPNKSISVSVLGYDDHGAGTLMPIRLNS